MKDNRLFSAMSDIDDNLIEEAIKVPAPKKLPVRMLAAVAAALAVAAVSAVVLVNVSHRQNVVVDTSDSAAGQNQAAESKPSEAKEQTRQSSEAVITEASGALPSDSSQPETSRPSGEDESDLLGFIIKDGRTYMQVILDADFTPDKVIGLTSDFAGLYHDLDDGSKVYSVKEDDKILIVEFAAGGRVTLMLWEPETDGYFRFAGLRIDARLNAALMSNDGRAYSVYVNRPDSDDMYDYVYNGKTLREIKAAFDESQKTEHGKYNPLEEEYQAALHAFLKEKIHRIYEILIQNGIKAELINDVRCEAQMTKEQLKQLAVSGSYDEYAFCLNESGYLIDDPGA